MPVSSEKIRKIEREIFLIVKKGRSVALHKNYKAIRFFTEVIHIFH